MTLPSSEPAIGMLVLGAEGRLGRRVCAALDGECVVAIDRRGSVASMPPDTVVINLASDDPAHVTAWAGVGTACKGYVDAGPTGASRAVLAQAQLQGPGAVVSGVGWFSAVGDALAVVAARRLDRPVRADVTAWTPGASSLWHDATPRERAAWVAAAGAPMRVWTGGHIGSEHVAQGRRLAWFPRPVGPHHAATIPGTHGATLPRVVPSLTEVRTSLALRSWVAELVQAGAAVARWRAGRGRQARAPRTRTDRGATSRPWAIVAEVATQDGALVRAWAYGTDRHGVTAQTVAAAARACADPPPSATCRPGVAELVDAERLLDQLAARTDLRWSCADRVTRPTRR